MNEQPCDIKTCFLCNHSSREWRELIAIRKTTSSFKKGASIFNEGDPARGIFFVFEGSVKIHMQWGGQKDLIIRFAKSGDILGYRGLGSKHVHPVTATALESVKVCYIPNDFLEATLKTNVSFSHALIQIYADELQKAEKRMRDLVHMEVKGRVALALIEMAEFFGTDTGNFIAVPVLRQDIASYAGTTYETVFKLLTEFTSKKIISTLGKSIKINSPGALKQLITYHK
jgi:CRP/FNR family transcriptional regulator